MILDQSTVYKVTAKDLSKFLQNVWNKAYTVGYDIGAEAQNAKYRDTNNELVRFINHYEDNEDETNYDSFLEDEDVDNDNEDEN